MLSPSEQVREEVEDGVEEPDDPSPEAGVLLAAPFAKAFSIRFRNGRKPVDRTRLSMVRVVPAYASLLAVFC